MLYCKIQRTVREAHPAPRRFFLCPGRIRAEPRAPARRLQRMEDEPPASSPGNMRTWWNGRHASLRSLRPHGRESSSLSVRTTGAGRHILPGLSHGHIYRAPRKSLTAPTAPVQFRLWQYAKCGHCQAAASTGSRESSRLSVRTIPASERGSARSQVLYSGRRAGNG